MSRNPSRNNSIISIGGTVYDSNNQRVTPESLKGRNPALDFALKTAQVKQNPRALRALHALVNTNFDTNKAGQQGRRDSNASGISTDSAYEVKPSRDGRDLHVSRVHVAKVRGASEETITRLIRRPSLDDFSWTGDARKEPDDAGNLQTTIKSSIVIPGVLNKGGLWMGGEYEDKGKLTSKRHTKSRRRMRAELAEAKKNATSTVAEPKRR